MELLPPSRLRAVTSERIRSLDAQAIKLGLFAEVLM
jgi:hypothetical protein